MYQFWRYWLNLKGYLKEGVNIYTEQEGEVSRCSPAPEGRVCSGWYGPKRESHYIKSLYIYIIVLNCICYNKNMQTFFISCSFKFELQNCFSRSNITLRTRSFISAVLNWQRAHSVLGRFVGQTFLSFGDFHLYIEHKNISMCVSSQHV